MCDCDLIKLLILSSEGNQVAFSELYNRTNKIIYSLIMQMVRDTHTAEDVLLEVYLQVWKQAALYDSHRGSPMVWITTIARSRGLDRIRSNRRYWAKLSLKEIGTEGFVTTTPEDDAIYSEHKKFIYAAILSLSPEQRIVIDLAYFEGFSYPAIAKELNQPLGTIKTRARLGMIKLRHKLDHLFSEPLAI